MIGNPVMIRQVENTVHVVILLHLAAAEATALMVLLFQTLCAHELVTVVFFRSFRTFVFSEAISGQSRRSLEEREGPNPTSH